MVTVIQPQNDWADAFREIGSGLVKGYMGRSDENAVRKAIMDLGPNAAARDILNALTNTKTYGQEAKQNALKNYLGVEEFEELKRKAKAQEDIETARNTISQAKEAREAAKQTGEKTQVQNIVDQLDLPQDKKTVLRDNIDLDTAQSLLKEGLKPKQQTHAQKKQEEKNALDYSNLTREEIPKLQTTLDDIAYARKLSDDLGVKGMVTGALGLSSKAKELEGVGFTLMQPIVKIFNPSGPIAQQKLKMIQDKYAISPSDAPWTRKGKLDALERFAKQALHRAQQKVQMIEQYDGNPPEDVLERFDKESDTIGDAMMDYDILAEEAQLPFDAKPSDFKGQTITSPEGQKYYSDGTRWVKK